MKITLLIISFIGMFISIFIMEKEIIKNMEKDKSKVSKIGAFAIVSFLAAFALFISQLI